MVSMQEFLLGLMLISVLTGLATEAVKAVLTEYGKTYRANTLAGVISVILSLGIGSAYIVLNNTQFTVQMLVCLIALIFMSWLCAMVGYDKVIQAISQFKKP